MLVACFLGTSLPPTPSWSSFDLYIYVYSIVIIRRRIINDDISKGEAKVQYSCLLKKKLRNQCCGFSDSMNPKSGFSLFAKAKSRLGSGFRPRYFLLKPKYWRQKFQSSGEASVPPERTSSSFQTWHLFIFFLVWGQSFCFVDSDPDPDPKHNEEIWFEFLSKMQTVSFLWLAALLKDDTHRPRNDASVVAKQKSSNP